MGRFCLLKSGWAFWLKSGPFNFNPKVDLFHKWGVLQNLLGYGPGLSSVDAVKLLSCMNISLSSWWLVELSSIRHNNFLYLNSLSVIQVLCQYIILGGNCFELFWTLLCLLKINLLSLKVMSESFLRTILHWPYHGCGNFFVFPASSCRK